MIEQDFDLPNQANSEVLDQRNNGLIQSNESV